MRLAPLLLLLPLVACSGSSDAIYETGADSGLPVCGRVRGTSGVLLYEDEGTTVRSPAEEPDATSVTTGVAGPLDADGLMWLAVTDGRVIQSVDAGCNWDTAGYLPAGDWALRLAGTRAYAFDRASGAGAYSADSGASWTPFDAGAPFFGLPAPTPADPVVLTGVQARGVVASTDSGATWSVKGEIPSSIGTLQAAAVDGAGVVFVAGSEGLAASSDSGLVFTDLRVDADVTSLAVHPDTSDVIFYIATDATDMRSIWRLSVGGTPERLVDETQLAFASDMPLYPLPGDTSAVLAGYGPVPNNEDVDSLALYTMRVGEGAKTVRLTTFFQMHQLAFGPDRWVAAVDSVPAR